MRGKFNLIWVGCTLWNSHAGYVHLTGPLTYKQETKEEKEVEVTAKIESVEAIKIEKKESNVKEGPSKPLPPKKTSPVAVNAKKEVLKVFAIVAVLTFFILIFFSFFHVVGEK